MTSVGRFLAFLGLLACMLELYECKEPEPLDWGIEREKETKEEKDYRIFYMCHKHIFVRSKKLKTDEIVNCIKAMEPFKDQQHRFPFNLNELMAFQEPKEELCDSRDHLVNLKHIVKTSKDKYPAIHQWVEEAFQKQMNVCNFGGRFKKKLEDFKMNHPQQWEMVQNFYACAKNHGVPIHDWKRKFMDNRMMMNKALICLFEWTYRDYDSYQGHPMDLQIKGYNMAVDYRNACNKFSEALSGILYMTTFSPTIKKDPEMLEWHRWDNVCTQAKDVNFNYGLNEINKLVSGGGGGFDEYLANRHLRV